MEATAQSTWQQIPLNDFKNYLDTLANELAEKDDMSVLLRRRGDQVLVYSPKRYSDEVNSILEESKREYERGEKAGYSREQAFQDFMKAQQELSQYLQ